ncbi:DUF4236 domain-containing protein [Sphingobium aromaticiconvertens]|uniref:DUF4236 domain-containing protein n=1 Tax=Sphingobium aromaticiconvertens TaxID=365341 RepID=UPI00301B55E8
MGFRFSKRISILPGVRINLSKSGASLSVGPRGASVTIGKQGVHGNVGIPGTGLSYRERLDKPSRTRVSDDRPQPSPKPELPGRVVVKIVEDQTEFFDDAEIPLDPSLIPSAKKALGDQLKDFLESHVESRNDSLDALGKLHHDIPTFLGSIPSTGGNKPQKEAFGSQEAYMDALMCWRAEQANSGPDQTALENALLGALGTLQWPYETNIGIDFTDGRLLLDVDLPEIEAMPESRWTTDHRRCSLISKALTKQQVAGLYVEHICSLILRLIGHSMAVSEGIKNVAISAYTQRNATLGRPDDEYVATVEISRGDWDQIDCTKMPAIDPQNLLRRYGACIETNARGILLVQRAII